MDLKVIIIKKVRKVKGIYKVYYKLWKMSKDWAYEEKYEWKNNQ